MHSDLLIPEKTMCFSNDSRFTHWQIWRNLESTLEYPEAARTAGESLQPARDVKHLSLGKRKKVYRTVSPLHGN